MGLLNKVQTCAPSLPSRVVLYAAEKSGKTSFGCHAPRPIFLMTAGETGLLSLIESQQVPETAHFPTDFQAWRDLEMACRALRDEAHEYRTLILDTGNGAENLCMASVCANEFNDNWGEFNSYGRGMSATVPVWSGFLGLLDQIRIKRSMSILFLHHAKVKTFQDPAGKDWDQWRPEAQDKLWGLTHKWADVIAYYGQRVNVNRDDKAHGQVTRFLRLGSSPAMVAGNRYGMPDELVAPKAGAKALWDTFASTLRACKSKGKPAQQPPTPAPARSADEDATDTNPQEAEDAENFADSEAVVTQQPAAEPVPKPDARHVEPPHPDELDGIADDPELFKHAWKSSIFNKWAALINAINSEHQTLYTRNTNFEEIDREHRYWAANLLLTNPK